jgi:superfamily II DNA or RNA helicase
MTVIGQLLSLRPYQIEAIDALRAHIRAGRRRIVLIMPTGGGKTVVASAMIQSGKVADSGGGGSVLWMTRSRRRSNQLK